MNHRVNQFGLCVHPDYPTPCKHQPSFEALKSMTDELGIDHVLIRIPLADWKNRQQYYDIANTFNDKKILINILQDRYHIDNEQASKDHFTELFTSLQPITHHFQIGNTVNRRKWGVVSQDEYFKFFGWAQQIKQHSFPLLQLYGGNTIDFELPYFIRSVWHRWPIKYDGVTTQLYVDRRGAPENTQLACDTIAKINWFKLLTHLSPKTQNRLLITEVNWPIKDTRPYAPAYGDCMVDEKTQSEYLVRYYLLMIASGKIERCYWHQLVAPGYGLVDNRGCGLRKREAYVSYMTMVNLLKDTTTTHFSKRQRRYQLHFSCTQRAIHITAIWTTGPHYRATLTSTQHAIDLLGKTIEPDQDRSILISGRVTYVLDPHSNATHRTGA